VISEGENEGLASVNTEVVVFTCIPASEGSGDGCVDVAVVPEEVVGDALCKEGRVSEDREELAKFGEVVRDATAVVDSRREMLEEQSNVHNTFTDADGSALLEMSNHVLNIIDHGVGTVHAAEQIG
jgi:hypothetical protein